MNAGTVSTPCGQGGNQQPIPLPDTSLTGFTPLNQSYAPTSLSASDTNFTFTFSYTPPSAFFPPISEVQDPSQPAQLSYPLNPLDYTLYLDTQDVNGLHECQANLSQVGTTSNPGGNVLQAALGADYPLFSLNGPDTIATAAWVNPNPQNFTGTITVPAGWQCTGGQLQSSGSGGGVSSGNNSGSTGSTSGGSTSTGGGTTGGGTSGGSGSTINTSAWYNVINVNSGLCADVFEWGTDLGTSFDQWDCGNSQSNQEWQFTPVGNGIYQVGSRFVAMSWNVTGGTGATATKVPIQLWSYSGSSNRQWKAVLLRTDGNGNGVYKFIAQNSGLCLDTPGASKSDGVQLDQFV